MALKTSLLAYLHPSNVQVEIVKVMKYKWRNGPCQMEDEMVDFFALYSRFVNNFPFLCFVYILTEQPRDLLQLKAGNIKTIWIYLKTLGKNSLSVFGVDLVVSPDGALYSSWSDRSTPDLWCPRSWWEGLPSCFIKSSFFFYPPEKQNRFNPVHSAVGFSQL